MKKYVLLYVFLFIAFGLGRAQDVIVFQNGDELQAKVVMVSKKKISYYHFDNLEGPEYTVSKNEVHSIKYQNGSKVVFQKTETRKEHKFQANINGGVLFNNHVGGAWDVSLGVRINRYFFVGFEAGFGLYPYTVYLEYGHFEENDVYVVDGQDSYTAYGASIPLAVNFKVYLPLKKEIYPHLNLSSGFNFGIWSLYTQMGLGVDIKRFSIEMGYQLLPWSGDYYRNSDGYSLSTRLDSHLGYIKLGVRLGRK